MPITINEELLSTEHITKEVDINIIKIHEIRIQPEKETILILYNIGENENEMAEKKWHKISNQYESGEKIGNDYDIYCQAHIDVFNSVKNDAYSIIAGVFSITDYTVS